MEDKDFGKHIKERFENYEVQPSNKVWDKINQQLDVPMVAPKTFPWKMAAWIGSAIVVVATVTTVWFMNNPTKEKTKHSDLVASQTQPTVSSTNIVDSQSQTSPSQTTVIPKEESQSETSAKPVQKNQSNASNSNTVQITDKASPVVSTIKEAQTSNNNTLQSNNASINAPIPESVKPTTINTTPKKTTTGDKIPATKGTSPADIELTGKTVICKGEEAKLEAKGGTSYLWSTYERTSSITVRPEETTTYFVVITPENGIEIEKQITVTVNECEKLIVPTAFTPNADRNNIFKVYAQGISNFEIIIMSRQGQQVFQSKDVNFGWDGTFRNEILPAGVYMYMINYKDPNGLPKRKAGPITLIR